MNKQEVVAHIANQLDSTQAAAERALAAVISALEQAFQHNKPLIVPGLGTFGTRERAARTGRNPSTGEPLTIPARRMPYFKPSVRLKTLVNTTQEKIS